MKQYHAIGLMSGSSLDGLDIAHCRFETDGEKWQYEILESDCIAYDLELIQRLQNSKTQSPAAFARMHVDLGHYFGAQVASFIQRSHLQNKIDLVASHGHTIFHFPDQKMTCQIGDGAALCSHVKLPVVCDFRSLDIAGGGQGTPIVPIGDLLLFPEHTYMLNIGGIANISAKNQETTVAFDICAANQVLNYFSQKTGHRYDDRGSIAASGKINADILEKLNQLEYYQKTFPKSLDNSFSQNEIIPILEKGDHTIEDILCTYVEHIAVQINRHLKSIAKRMDTALLSDVRMLVSGGGALNEYLIQRMEHHCPIKIQLPESQLINYKEALVIALMGVLRIRKEVNVLSSVTGADSDSIGGALYIPQRN